MSETQNGPDHSPDDQVPEQPRGYRAPRPDRPAAEIDAELRRVFERDQTRAKVDDPDGMARETERVADYFGRLFRALQVHGFRRDEAFHLIEVYWTILFAERGT